MFSSNLNYLANQSCENIAISTAAMRLALVTRVHISLSNIHDSERKDKKKKKVKSFSSMAAAPSGHLLSASKINAKGK